MSEGDPSPGDPSGGDGSSGSKFNTHNPAVKRILREQREMLASDEDENESWCVHAEMCEDDIFEWHFAIMGAEGSEFEGGIYHGRILLPPEYPFKPPSFMLLTPSGRFETMTKICLSITQHHPEHWQPSWSVRTALLAVRAFMPTPADGAVGSLEFTPDERASLAVRSREEVPSFGNVTRRELTQSVHDRMLRRWETRVEAKRREEIEAEGETIELEGTGGGGGAGLGEPTPRKVEVTEEIDEEVVEEEEEETVEEVEGTPDGTTETDGGEAETHVPAPEREVPASEREVHVEREVPAPTPTPAPRPQPAPTPPPPAPAPTRPVAGVTDSPAVADLKRKLDLLAVALVAAIAAILIRKFLRSLGEGEL
tara:strand:+ start:783 stop:1886 length:1104 start_codon:yes stop_codon:yes gene_type:complete